MWKWNETSDLSLGRGRGSGCGSAVPLNTVAVICVDCGVGNPDTNAYCGGCGKRIARRGDGVALHPGFAGPRRLLVASGIVFAMSAATAVAAFLLIQVSSPASMGLDFGGPIVGMLLDVAGVSASGSQVDLVSLLVVGTFLLASMVAISSVIAGAAGGIWLFARWRKGDGPARVGAAIATAGETSRKGLASAQRRGAEGLEHAKPRIADAAEHSRAVVGQAKDGAAERYEDLKPVVRRVARESRATLSEEVAPRVSTGLRKGTARCREWVRARREKSLESGDGPR